MRKILTIIGLSIIALVFIGAPIYQASEAKEPIKIGCIHPVTGPHAAVGLMAEEGIHLLFEEVGRRVAGRDIVLIREDSEGKPNVALAKTKRLVEGHKVNVLIGPCFSHVAYALRDYVHSQKIPMVITIAGARALTEQPEKFSPYIICQAESSKTTSRMYAKYAAEELNFRKVISIFTDLAVGYDVADSFKTAFEAAGGRVLEEIATPFPTGDYAPYIAKIDPTKIDCTNAWFGSSDAVRFVKQYAKYGLQGKLPIIGHYAIAEENNLDAMGDPAIGIYTGAHYVWTIDTPANNKFRSAYEARYNKKPARASDLGYAASKIVYEALQKTGGRTDVNTLLKVIKESAFDVPRGTISFDERGRVISNGYITKIVKKKGVLQHQILKTYEKLREKR